MHYRVAVTILTIFVIDSIDFFRKRVYNYPIYRYIKMLKICGPWNETGCMNRFVRTLYIDTVVSVIVDRSTIIRCEAIEVMSKVQADNRFLKHNRFWFV